jgi:putative ABC transport system permease protein
MREWVETLAQDLRYAIRGLRQHPGFTVVAVLTLAIGISATTTIFSVTDAILLRPLAYPGQDRLVQISTRPVKHPDFLGDVSQADLACWRAENQAFEQIETISRPDLVGMSGAGNPERIGVQHVSAGLFNLLGASAVLGTLPSKQEANRGDYDGVVLGYEFWQRHFGGDPKVLGRRIFVDSGPGTIVAILNRGFDFFGSGPPAVLVMDGVSIPKKPEDFEARWLIGVGKLKPGVSLQQAQASMEVIAQRLAQSYPEAYREMGLRVLPLREGLFGWSKNYLYPLFAAVIFILLIACVNVASLLLFRADARRKEISVRVALGASRTRLIRQLLTESVLLAFIGGAAGLLFSLWGVKLFDALSPGELPRAAGSAVSARVFLFTFATCILTGLAFGLAPAFRSWKSGVNDCLKEGGRSSGAGARRGMRNMLAVAEVGLALVLLVCAGLMINTLARVLHTSPGFNPKQLLTAEIRLTGKKYIEVSLPGTDLSVIRPQVAFLCKQILEKVKGLPGVESAALIDWLPLSEDAQHVSYGFAIAGQPSVLSSQRPRALFSSVSSDYFRVMGIPVLKGRSLTEQDTESMPWVVVINDAMAKKFWPNQDAIGQTITFDSTPDERPRQVVGIVGDVRQFILTANPVSEIYAPYSQLPVHSTGNLGESRLHKSLVVQTNYMSKALVEGVRRAVAELADDSPIFGITTVEQTVSDSARPWSFLARLLAIFASVALLLAVIGVYGVISYSVSERSQEIGLRMALGAQSSQVIGLVLKQTLGVSLLGVLVGLAGSMAATPVLSKFLYGVKPHDLMTLSLVSVLLIAATLLASYVPARRATRIDPLAVLRHE